MDFIASVLAVLIFILILLIITKLDTAKPEHFDVYNNHYIGAADVYGYMNPSSAVIRAKYDWRDQDPKTGMRVYDHVYENELEARQWPEDYKRIASYDAYGAIQPQPAVTFNGQVITLSQKNN
jgi:hypothetical protein